MPRTRMVPCCTEKTVLIAVYVEKPNISKRFSLNHHNLHDQHAIIKQEVIHYKKHGADYDRRAELLSYSRRLRESSAPSASSPSQPMPKPKPLSPNNHQPLTRTLSVQRKQKHSRTPNCLSNWKILIPRSLLRSFTSKDRRGRRRKTNGFSTDKIKSIVKSFDVRKNLGFVSNFLSKLRKRR